MLDLDAPSALRIPISFVLSITEIWVIIPIMIEETTSEIDTKAISTAEITVTMLVTELAITDT